MKCCAQQKRLFSGKYTDIVRNNNKKAAHKVISNNFNSKFITVTNMLSKCINK